MPNYCNVTSIIFHSGMVPTGYNLAYECVYICYVCVDMVIVTY